MQNHLTELLTDWTRRLRVRLLAGSRTPGSMQVARHSGEASRRRGWAAEPSFRAFAPGGESAKKNWPPGAAAGGQFICGETGFRPQAPPRLRGGYEPIAGSGAPPGARSVRTWRIVATEMIAPTSEIAAPTYRAGW